LFVWEIELVAKKLTVFKDFTPFDGDDLCRGSMIQVDLLGQFNVLCALGYLRCGGSADPCGASTSR